MAADLLLTNQGIQYAGGNIVDLKAVMPSSGSYTAGDIVLESTTGVRISGWKRLTTGSAHVLNTDWAYFSASPQLGAAVATTSGTSIDFTSIPSWVKRITVMFNGVSTSGTSPVEVRIGSGSIQTTGYATSAFTALNANTPLITNPTDGFAVMADSAATYVRQGLLVLTTSGSNVWSASGNGGDSSSARAWFCGGSVTLSGTIDRLRLTTVGGTDTFDAGSINILYE